MPKTKDLSTNGLYSITQTIKITGLSKPTVKKYAKKLDVPMIDCVRYFNDAKIAQMLQRPRKIKEPKDISGRKKHYLTAIEFTGKIAKASNGNNTYVWKWKCVCGKIIEKSLEEITHHDIRSCGCESLKTKRNKAKEIQAKVKLYDGTNIGIIKSKKLNKRNKTGVRGVYIDNKTKKFVAHIGFKSKRFVLGQFETIEKARKARKLAEKKYFDPIVNEYESLSEIRNAIKQEVENGI